MRVKYQSWLLSQTSCEGLLNNTDIPIICIRNSPKYMGSVQSESPCLRLWFFPCGYIDHQTIFIKTNSSKHWRMVLLKIGVWHFEWSFWDFNASLEASSQDISMMTKSLTLWVKVFSYTFHQQAFPAFFWMIYLTAGHFLLWCSSWVFFFFLSEILQFFLRGQGNWTRPFSSFTLQSIRKVS